MLKNFWRQVGKKVWVNDFKDSMNHVGVYRQPPPSDQPMYTRPESEASEISDNSYYKRDVRRNYPKMAVYSQNDVANLILASSQRIEDVKAESNPVAKTEHDLTKTIVELNIPLYSTSNLPPTPGTPYKYTLSEEQEIQQPGQYFPTYKVY
ncbi:hypothetical protein BB559_000076 [Furculomyces boomerangus]|uniref:NADH dehydrogenase [ubiquinone] 1 alpha subcomplex subunit 7 n=2 Tax=Harpellales TaxID=61421 RepID=A0A2T9Z6D1_9FUNG|nr:hypothetical protein BB559_000076 [Furculomyces boomerangus]PWA00626.1 hypothetical protein BB558_003320 [Smittium angustum]